MNSKYETLVSNISTFFNSKFEANYTNIFEPIKKIMGFDDGYIYFINPESVKLKYTTSEEKNETDIEINSDVKNELFSSENIICSSENNLIKLLGFNQKSYLIIKLNIRNAVYGFMLLAKSKADFYEEDLKIADAIGSIVSYKIKDIELADVFQDQIKTLADNVVEIKAADLVKTEFLANISHELRTPLNAIIGFSEILKNGFYGKLNEKQTGFVDDIHVSGIHLLEMINELLDISKIEAGAMQLNLSNFDINMAVSEVVNVVAPLANKKNVAINTAMDYSKEITADYQKIKQILFNLISNAIKFSPENDCIEIKINKNKQDIILEVKDNGVGIATENQKKIFEKFVQLENAFTKKESSTGLGLAITKKLVQMHKGTISVKSELNKGATFIVKIPCFAQ